MLMKYEIRYYKLIVHDRSWLLKLSSVIYSTIDSRDGELDETVFLRVRV